MTPDNLYNTEAKANEIAAANNAADDDGWTYTVKPVGRYFAIEVRDEYGVVLGNL